MKKFFLKLALVFVGGLTLASCGTKEKSASLEDIAGEWVIVTINGEPISSTLEKTPFLAINALENRLYGTTGCNNINGMIERDSLVENQFSFKNVATTMMMCPEMETESLVLKVLSEVKKADVAAGDKLVLLDATNKEVMQLVKK
ncbi:MAG: META domain-containing protein [Phocaeicola sp.]